MSRLATLIACTLLLSGCTALQIGKPTKSVETPFTLPELWVQSNEGSEGEINLMVYPSKICFAFFEYRSYFGSIGASSLDFYNINWHDLVIGQ